MSRLISRLGWNRPCCRATGPLPAGDKEDKNVHTGTLISVKGKAFVMEARARNILILAPTAKWSMPSKDITLTDLVKATSSHHQEGPDHRHAG